MAANEAAWYISNGTNAVIATVQESTEDEGYDYSIYEVSKQGDVSDVPTDGGTYIDYDSADALLDVCMEYCPDGDAIELDAEEVLDVLSYDATTVDELLQFRVDE